MTPTQSFARARKVLLRHRDDPAKAVAEFQWPALDEFNWASDWFDSVRPAPQDDLGKDRRVELRTAESARHAKGERSPQEFWIDD